MGSLAETPLREARDPVFALLLAAIAVSFVKAVDQPGVTVGVGSSSARVTIGDAVLAALAVAVVARVARERTFPRATLALVVLALAFAALIVVTAAANGSAAFIAAGKLDVLATIVVGCVVLIDSTQRLWAVTTVVVAVTTLAAAWAIVGFVQSPGSRQPAFLGEHDLAAVSTSCLVLGLATLHVRHRLGRLPVVAGVAGCVGIALGAALASLLGLYLAAAAMILISWLRGSLRLRAVVWTVVVTIALTGATYGMRAGELGFLQQWFAPAENAEPGQYAASWSQRLLFTYIGGRIFLDQPILGTGWWGNLPPSEYARYLADARARFSDQPANYFPPADGVFIPQQTFDQVLYELGVVGGVLLLALFVVATRDALRSGLRWPRGEPDELAAYLALPWLASIVGALAGSALFGGTPMATLFWLTLGLVGALTVLAAVRARSTA